MQMCAEEHVRFGVAVEAPQCFHMHYVFTPHHNHYKGFLTAVPFIMCSSAGLWVNMSLHDFKSTSLCALMSEKCLSSH